MAAKNFSRIRPPFPPPPCRHLYSTATAATKWYTPPPSSQIQDSDPIITALSQAVQNFPAKPLQVSLKQLLPSLNARHIIKLIRQNPHSLSPVSIFSLFTTLSSASNSTFRHTLHSYCTMIHFLSTHQMFSEAKNLLQIVVSRKGKDSASEVFAAFLETKGLFLII